jgi:hypothetical protein
VGNNYKEGRKMGKRDCGAWGSGRKNKNSEKIKLKKI